MNRFSTLNRIKPCFKRNNLLSQRSLSISAEERAKFYASYIPNKIVERLHVEYHTEFRMKEAKYEMSTMLHGLKCDVVMRLDGKTVNFQVDRPYDVPADIKKRDEFLKSKDVIVVRPDISMFDERLLEYMEKV